MAAARDGHKHAPRPECFGFSGLGFKGFRVSGFEVWGLGFRVPSPDGHRRSLNPKHKP